MNRYVSLSRASADAAAHGSSVIGNDGSKPPTNPADSDAFTTAAMWSM